MRYKPAMTRIISNRHQPPSLVAGRRRPAPHLVQLPLLGRPHVAQALLHQAAGNEAQDLRVGRARRGARGRGKRQRAQAEHVLVVLNPAQVHVEVRFAARHAAPRLVGGVGGEERHEGAPHLGGQLGQQVGAICAQEVVEAMVVAAAVGAALGPLWWGAWLRLRREVLLLREVDGPLGPGRRGQGNRHAGLCSRRAGEC